MRQPSPFLPAALLLATALAGQQNATFHLPAGEHRLDQLLARCEQAVKAPIALVDLGGIDERRPVHLQCDLALPGDAWEDVLGSLLVAHGLVLTFDAANQRHEVLAAPAVRAAAPWLALRARAFAVADFLARPSHQGPVRVAVPGAGKHLAMASSMLRPLAFGLSGGLQVAANGDDLQLVGLGAGVRSALMVLSAADPDLAAALPKQAAAPWPRAKRPTTQSLAAGIHTLAEVVDCLARATGRNLVVDAAVGADLRFELPAAVAGDADAIEEALTKLLWQQHVVVLGLAPAHGVFVVQLVSPQQRPASGLACTMHADEVLARPDLVAYVQLVYQPRHVGLDKVVPAAMGVLRAGAGPLRLCEAIGSADGLVLRGLTQELRPVLERLQDVDRAP